MKSSLSVVLSAILALGLVACGGGGSETPQVASSDVKVNADSSTTEAFANETFAFDSGVAALGTSGVATSLTFTSGSSFAVSAGGNTASGGTTYGSCIFTVQSTTFGAGHPLGTVGQSVRIDPCQIDIKARGVAATGVPASVNAQLVLGSLASRGVSTSIRITESGELYVGQALFGTVTTVPPTGATGSGL
ncbi:hypothetical protein [Ramlibacter rhizophilus]|uniref:Uncharacterized protein n=1 Tax=Ramlibacter rhizophilus TaxID=1781167 RepID=A0A4Z0C121_9BURK|nr:hypothetical protein [Ramlibacter rhizophilus]TFZ04218.1 hypothetical protein EZ242_00175 [Ramlibacter rhizophilus]